LVMGRTSDARDAATRAVAIDTKTLGADNPDLGASFTAMGDVLAAEGRWTDAVAAYERALTLLAGYGADNRWLLEPLSGLSAALVAAGDGARAVSIAERAVAVADGHHVSTDLAGAARFRRAQARWAVGTHRDEALAEARTERALLAALPYPAEILPAIDRWLSERK
jgi:tetratricopeptide (TPR) repeat protein